MQATKEVNRHPRIAPCVNTWSVTLFLSSSLSSSAYATCQMLMHALPHRPGRPSGMDHTNRGKRRISFIVSHATLIIEYHDHANTTKLRMKCTLVATKCDTTEFRM